MILTNIIVAIPALAGWAQHKSRVIIRSGLNQRCSEINQEDWDILPASTNTVEALHDTSYRWSGRYQPLRSCLESYVTLNPSWIDSELNYYRNRNADIRLVTSSQSFAELGVNILSRNTSFEARHKRAAEAERK